MMSVSQKFSRPVWVDWRGTVQPVPQEIQRVAAAFADLQQERHIADYDNYQEWGLDEVLVLLETVTNAFAAWESIRTHPMAGNYLLAMLLPKR